MKVRYRKMNIHVRRTVKFIALGEMFGLVFSLFFNYLYGNFSYMPSTNLLQDEFSRRPLNGMLYSVLIWAMMGILFGWGAFIFDIKQWSLVKQTIVNFIVYYIGFSILAVLAGWFSISFTNFIIFSSIFMLAYIIIWLATYYQTAKKDQVD